MVNPEAQGPDAPPPPRRCDHFVFHQNLPSRRQQRGLARLPAVNTPCGFQRWSITEGRSLPVCRGRAPCRGSVGSSQSSRCVFDKVCLSRISVPNPSALEGSQPQVDDSRFPSPVAVATSPQQAPPASEPEALRVLVPAGANPPADSSSISVR